ncbi:MAG: glycosyltransferase family 4 protein [Cytophaga sp.]|uniref:glycosyltransferase family 4 protein n=1 Tax=Cytophaga sp. TaxID=29535 RepID=UPI003F7E4914
MKISVAIRQKFHAFDLAQQLQNHGLLEKLYTSFYGNIGNRSNNKGYTISESRVRTSMINAFFTYIYREKDPVVAYQRFGKWAANQLREEDMVVSWGLAATPIFNRAEKTGIVKVLERGSSHVLYQRDILLEEYAKLNADASRLKNSFAQHRLEREIEEYHRADRISIPSSFVERTFIAHGIDANKLIKVPYGVNLSRFSPAPKRDKIFRVIYVGAMSIRKGVHYLLQAFKELNLPQAELCLIGAMTPEMQPVFAQYEGSFVYHAPMPQDQLAAYLTNSNLFAICSLEEGLAMVQPQAMACGLPLLCTTNTGGDDLINNGVEGFVVQACSVKELKEKIEYCYMNQEATAEMGTRAYEKVRSGFTWDDYGNTIIKKLKEINHTL